MTAKTPCRSHDKDRLYRKRFEAGLTQPELAERAGVALGTVSNAENGQTISVRSLHRLAAGLGCDVIELMSPDGRDPE